MIEKIAKRLKRFTLSEIELIVGFECINLIETLIKEGKLKVCGKYYEYIEPKIENFKIVSSDGTKERQISIQEAVGIFLKHYAEPNCKTWTVKTYISIFKTNILPYFKNRMLNDLDLDGILEFYEWLKSKNLSELRTKNTMALLNQLIHYFQGLGMIDRRCEFSVQRIDSRKSNLRNVI